MKRERESSHISLELKRWRHMPSFSIYKHPISFLALFGPRKLCGFCFGSRWCLSKILVLYVSLPCLQLACLVFSYLQLPKKVLSSDVPFPWSCDHCSEWFKRPQKLPRKTRNHIFFFRSLRIRDLMLSPAFPFFLKCNQGATRVKRSWFSYR